MNLRVTIVGAGRMGRERARAAKLLGASVMTVCDPERTRADLLAAEYGAAVLYDPAGINWSATDAVFVCTPPASRGPVELAAISAGVPVFLEKPIGLSAAHAEPILRMLRTKQTINAVGYMNRYRRSVLNAKRALENVAPVGAVFHWIGTRYRTPWWLKQDQSGGPLNEQCTHFVDLFRFLVGEIIEVQSLTRPLADAPDVIGTASISLRFENGALGSGFYSCEGKEKQIGLEVFLASHSVRLEGWDLRSTDSSNLEEDIFAKESGAFFQAIDATTKESPILSDCGSAARTQRVVDAIFASARSGRVERAATFESLGNCA